MPRMSQRLRFVLPLLLTCACVSDPNDAQTWIKKLRDVRSQKEALHNLKRINDKAAVPPLIALYQDPRGSKDPEVLDAILHFHDAQAIPLCIANLEYTEEDFD